MELVSDFESPLVAAMLDFLKSNKITDTISDELQEQIYCPVLVDSGHRLEDVLADALANGRDVFVTGSAGGGKTTLVNRIQKLLVQRGVRAEEVKTTLRRAEFQKGDVCIVKDLTAMPPDKRAAIFKPNFEANVLIAANVGTLQGLRNSVTIQSVLNTLVDMQVGVTVGGVEGPVVVDMAAIDPMNQGLDFLLGHQLIHEAVQMFELESGRDADSSLRLQALKQLKNPIVRRRVTEVVRSARGPGEITYRELWNFVSDLFLGGLDDNRPATSVWFWRLFFGNSALASSTSEAVLPNLIALPYVARALFKNVRRQLNLDAESDLIWVDPGVAPDNDALQWTAAQRLELFNWLRIQYAFVAASQSSKPSNLFFGLSLRTRGVNVFEVDSDATPLLQSINAYFRRQVAEASNGSYLELWIDLLVERRTDGSKAIVSLGRVGESRFRIVRSSAVSNLDSVSLRGNRIFLQSFDGGSIASTLEISGTLLLALAQGRTSHITERRFTDVDYAIRKFFVETANAVPVDSPKILSVLSYDVDDESSEISWDLDGSVLTLRKSQQ